MVILLKFQFPSLEFMRIAEQNCLMKNNLFLKFKGSFIGNICLIQDKRSVIDKNGKLRFFCGYHSSESSLILYITVQCALYLHCCCPSRRLYAFWASL